MANRLICERILCIFLSALVDDFAALHCAHFVSLPNFGFEMKIRNSGFDISDSDYI